MVERGFDLGLVEIHREDIADLPYLMAFLEKVERHFIIFPMISHLKVAKAHINH